MKHINTVQRVIILFLFFISANVFAQQAEKPVPLDPKVQVPTGDDEVSPVYKDMVVVQRKAKQKAGSFLFSTFTTIDFSDGPISTYAINTNLGYAISDFFEVYINVAPSIIVTERPIVQQVRSLTSYTITYGKPLLQYGLEALWLPAYGKESWGPYSIVRSDTFFKFGASQINYEGNNAGLRFTGMIGKTYFLAKYLNIRVGAGTAYVQTFVQNLTNTIEKKSNWVPVLEAGLVAYF